MSSRRAAFLLTLPVLASACGGSKHTSSTTTASTTPALTASQLVQAANQVCIRSDRRVYRIGRLSRDPVGWQQTADAGRIGIREMRALTPPAADAARFNLMLSYAQQLVNAIQAVHDNLVKKQYDKAISAQFRAARFQDKTHATAKQLGLTFCQQSLTNWPA